MKFSEAMVLGSLTLEPMAGVRGYKNDSFGCAIGMAEHAVGIRTGFAEAERQWTWLDMAVAPPCNCYQVYHNSRPASIVAHLFNEHVMDRYDTDWTFNRLVAWVKSIEPEEASDGSGKDRVDQASGVDGGLRAREDSEDREAVAGAVLCSVREVDSVR